MWIVKSCLCLEINVNCVSNMICNVHICINITVLNFVQFNRQNHPPKCLHSWLIFTTVLNSYLFVVNLIENTYLHCKYFLQCYFNGLKLTYQLYILSKLAVCLLLLLCVICFAPGLAYCYFLNDSCKLLFHSLVAATVSVCKLKWILQNKI